MKAMQIGAQGIGQNEGVISTNGTARDLDGRRERGPVFWRNQSTSSVRRQMRCCCDPQSMPTTTEMRFLLFAARPAVSNVGSVANRDEAGEDQLKASAAAF